MAHIALIEDDRVMVATMERYLHRQGHSLSIAEEGNEAVELINNEKEQFEIILLDICLPNLNGYQIYEQYRGNKPVIYITSFDHTSSKKKAMQLGAADYLVKSNLDLDYLNNRINQLIHR